MNLPKRTLYLILLLVIITAALLYLAFAGSSPQMKNNRPNQSHVSYAPTPPVALSTLTLLPRLLNVTDQSAQVMQIMIATDTNKVSGIQLEISYDPSIIGNFTITPGSFLPNATLLINKRDSLKGRVTYAFALPLGAKGVSGSGVVASIQFTPTGVAKQTTINLLNTSIVSAQGVSSSVLKTAAGATITFSQSAK